MSSNSSNDGSSDGVPFYLMPVAAILGMYTVAGGCRLLHQIYRNVRYDPSTATAQEKINAPTPLKSRSFALHTASVVLAIVLYGAVVARVDNAMADARIFDPFEILDIARSSNSTEIKRAYRTLSKRHHPDKGGDQSTFHDINLAYRALTDETSRSNWEKFGHPDGRQHQSLSFALPEWLLHPQGTTAVILVLLYLGMFAALIRFVIRWGKQTEESANRAFMQSSVDEADIDYFRSHLKDDCSHLETLLFVATTPESLQFTQRALEKQEKQRAEKLELLKQSKKESPQDKKKDFELDDGGWADDDEEEDEAARAAAEAARKHEREEQMAARQLAATTGKLQPEDVGNVVMEGIDEGVIGRKWVEDILSKAGVWPPTDNEVAALRAVHGEEWLDDPAIRRNVLMTVARLHSQLLNTHPDLVSAGPKNLIDAHYFKYSMEFRQRNALLLEAALRVAIGDNSYELAKKIIEAVTMFKVGTASATDEKNIKWFKDVIERQYGGKEGLPRLDVQEKGIETPGEDEIATDDTCALNLMIVRMHAQKFFENKMELCKRQGMDPRIALQTYHEGWWILVRVKRVALLEGGDGKTEDDDDDEPFVEEEPRLILAWPFIVRGIAQKAGKIRCQFKAPGKPGKYKFLIDIKSQDFLGADQIFEIDCDVLDQEAVKRKEEEMCGGSEGDDGAEDDDVEDESKKDK